MTAGLPGGGFVVFGVPNRRNVRVSCRVGGPGRSWHSPSRKPGPAYILTRWNAVADGRQARDRHSNRAPAAVSPEDLTLGRYRDEPAGRESRLL